MDTNPDVQTNLINHDNSIDCERPSLNPTQVAQGQDSGTNGGTGRSKCSQTDSRWKPLKEIGSENIHTCN
jgi:hypothetical protein